MDGNRRWAQQRNVSLYTAYRQGILTLRQIVHYFLERQRSLTLSFYAFSKENWKRSKFEKKIVFQVGLEFIKNIKNFFSLNEVSFSFIGDRTQWPEEHLKYIQELEKNCTEKKRVHVVIALSYSGQWDIDQAIAKSSQLGQTQNWTQFLQTVNLEDPDMLIRTGFQKRLSNYYLYTLAYTELFFPKLYWPELTSLEIEKLIHEYQLVERNFGSQALCALS